VYAALLGMSVPDTSGKAIAALGTENLRHVAPLHHGDTLYAESVVVATRRSRSRPAAGVVTVETRGHNQHGTLVCEFRRSFLDPIDYRGVERAPVDTSSANPGTAHICLFVRDLPRLYDELVAAGVGAVSAPVRVTSGPNEGRLAVYMIDPDGFRVELVTSEPEPPGDGATPVAAPR